MIVHDAAATFVDLIDAALWWFATACGALAFVLAVAAVTFALQPPKARRGAQASRGAPQPASCGSPRCRRGSQARTEPHSASAPPCARVGAHRPPPLRGDRVKATVLLLAGARELTEPGIVPGTLYDIAVNIAEGPIVVRHGACPGPRSADQAASDWINSIGTRHGITEDPMPADWDNCAPNCPPGHRRKKKPGDVAHPGLLDDYCPAAGPRRNAAMAVKLPRPEWMIAFPEPGQPNYGTRNCIRLAKQAGIHVRRLTAP